MSQYSYKLYKLHFFCLYRKYSIAERNLGMTKSSVTFFRYPFHLEDGSIAQCYIIKWARIKVRSQNMAESCVRSQSF